MLPKADWEYLIPHSGTMCLLDEVVAWDEIRLHARSASHLRANNPLRAEGVLHALNLCEYATQAMAIHGALRGRHAGGSARPGFLVALREVELKVERIDDLPGKLQIHVECLIAMAGSLQYAFRVEHRGAPLASGRAAVMLQGREEGR